MLLKLLLAVSLTASISLAAKRGRPGQSKQKQDRTYRRYARRDNSNTLNQEVKELLYTVNGLKQDFSDLQYRFTQEKSRWSNNEFNFKNRINDFEKNYVLKSEFESQIQLLLGWGKFCIIMMHHFLDFMTKYSPHPSIIPKRLLRPNQKRARTLPKPTNQIFRKRHPK